MISNSKITITPVDNINTEENSVIEVMVRPYNVKKVKTPNWCPLR